MGSQLTSSTTGTAFIALVRAEYNDATTNTFSDAELLKYINDGILEINTKTHCIQDTESVNLAANTVEYSIATDFIEVVAVHYVDASGKIWALKPGKPEDVGLTVDDTDAPVYWYEFKGKVGVYPTLASRTTETITVYKVDLTTDIVAGGTILTPKIYDNALMLYCLYRMQRKDGNPTAQTTYQQFMQDLGIYRQDFQDKVE